MNPPILSKIKLVRLGTDLMRFCNTPTSIDFHFFWNLTINWCLVVISSDLYVASLRIEYKFSIQLKSRMFSSYTPVHDMTTPCTFINSVTTHKGWGVAPSCWIVIFLCDGNKALSCRYTMHICKILSFEYPFFNGLVSTT